MSWPIQLYLQHISSSSFPFFSKKDSASGLEINDAISSGHWIGMMRVRQEGRKWIETAIEELQCSQNFKELTIPDLLNHIIAKGKTVNVHYINGHWLDVNSINDIGAAGDFTQ